MSDLLHHWFNTSKQSALKSISTKPFKITTRDAVIVTVIALVITLIFTWLYARFTNTPADYGSTIWQTIVISISSQYIYEYIGINNMLAESSIRYAKGSTLSKYVSRRNAMIYEIYYKLLASGLYTEDQLKANFTLLRLISEYPGAVSGFPDNINKISAKKRQELSPLNGLPKSQLDVLKLMVDRVNEDLAYDIMVNGIGDYKVIKFIGYEYIENQDGLEDRGATIREKIINSAGQKINN